MLFDVIFSFTKSAAQVADAAQKTVAEFIPTEPAETTSIPQHDPSVPFEVGRPQDPKLVRETLPPITPIADYLGSVSGAMHAAPDEESDLVTDPTQATDPAEAIMKSGMEAVKKFGANTSTPSVKPSPSPENPTPPEPPTPTTS
jgi:hypothetical protein